MTRANTHLDAAYSFTPNTFDHSGKHVSDDERDHLLRVGSAYDPIADPDATWAAEPADSWWRDWAYQGIDIETPYETHAHCVLREYRYLQLCRADLILFDGEDGYPIYIGMEPLRG